MNAARVACRSLFGLAIAVLLGLPDRAAAAPQSPFTFATIGVYTMRGDPVVPELELSSTNAGVSGQVGTAPAAFGRVRADFGSIGFAMEATQLDRGVAGGGLWSDGFVVDGGSGAASVTISTRLSGSITGQGELTYLLFASPQAFDLQFILDQIENDVLDQDPQLPNATRVLYLPEQDVSGAVDLSLFGSLSFTYGQPFYLMAGLAGEVAFVNRMDFYNSADFGITVPAGAVLRPLSGATYAAAVPEPATVLLLAAGLAAVARRVARSGTVATSGA